MSNYGAPEDAYWAFFDVFNANDAAGWAAVMSYPHVRVSTPPEGATPRTASRIFLTAEDYAGSASGMFERIAATGWVRTQGIEPERIHESDDRVHLAGGWTRYNASDEPILTNRVTYIMTRLNEGWGIQARFGLDSFTEDGTSASEHSALDVVGHASDALNERDLEGYASNFAFPLTDVRVGDVYVFEQAADLIAYRSAQTLPAFEMTATVVQAGSRGVNLAVEARGEQMALDVLMLVAQVEGTWGIRGRSIIVR